MRTKQFLTGLLLGGTLAISAQTTIHVKVSTALDDHEERIAGALPQTGTVGNMVVGSTELDLGNATATTDPLLIGLRFSNVNLPKQASISSAYIQFTVKGTSKNTDPCALNIYAENSGNSAPFTDNAFSLSSRSNVAGSISWNVSGTTWNTVGSATTDQRTPELKTLIQPLMFQSGWNPGNAMAFFIKGSGTREVEAYEDDPTKVAELVVTYSGGLPTGIAEERKNSSVMAYPNPFNNSFHISVELADASDIVISVMDITGKTVEQKIVKQAPAGVFKYSTSGQMQAGVYFVKVQTVEKQEVLKMIAE